MNHSMTVAVWANSDIYKIVEVPASLQGKELERVINRRLLNEVIEDFGQGAIIEQIAAQAFQINVDKVVAAVE
jgi:hypothetical protein